MAKAILSRVPIPERHCDIGADHGYLLRGLLLAEKIRFGIAIENKPAPLANCNHALAGLAADVRLGDGLKVLSPGEADSLSISGMGGELIVRILEARPEAIPDWIVLQANRQTALLRGWALGNGFHLVDEACVKGRWWYEVLTFMRRVGGDPAYEGLDREMAVQLGPLFLRRWCSSTQNRFASELDQLSKHARLNPQSALRKQLLQQAFELHGLSSI